MRLVSGSWLIPVGRTYRRKTVYFNLRGNVPHLAIAGVTGSGKSEFEKWLTYVLCNQQTPDDLEIHLIDLKGGATFAAFAHLPHVPLILEDGRYRKAIYDSTADAERALLHVQAELVTRLADIKDARFNFRPLPKFRELILMIDEGGELAPADSVGDEKKLRQNCMHLLSEIIRIGREPGIHVIYATQRPDKNTLPLTIRSQMEARFCFRVKEDYDSEIVLRHKGAEQLPKIAGRMIFQMPDSEQEVQAAYVPDHVITAWLKEWAGLVEVDGTMVDEVAPSSGVVTASSVVDALDDWGF